jgi:hypothetical protein
LTIQINLFLQTIDSDPHPSRYEIRAQAVTYRDVILPNFTSAYFVVSHPFSDQVVKVDDLYSLAENVTLLDEVTLQPLVRGGGYFQYSPPSPILPSPSSLLHLLTVSVFVYGLPESQVMDSWNAVYFIPPQTPLLLTPPSQSFDIPPSRRFLYYDSNKKQFTGHTDTPIIHVNSGAYVDVLFDNNPPYFFNLAAHPIHLHGHHFWVLGVGQGTFSFSNATMMSSLNFVNPPFRDTFRLPPQGWLLIRFKASSPGAWSLHCHTISHALFSMDRIFVVDRPNWPQIPKDFPKCGKYSSTVVTPVPSPTPKGGGAVGIGESRVMERVLITAIGLLFVAFAFIALLFRHMAVEVDSVVHPVEEES